jgi:hypothetical protein
MFLGSNAKAAAAAAAAAIIRSLPLLLAANAAQLYLQHGKVSQDLNIVLVQPQRIQVALDRFQIVVVRAIQ